jgi:hypothetical protein
MTKLFALIVGSIFWCFGLLDQLVFRRSLHRLVPHVEQLVRDPEGTLASDPLMIGPMRAYFVAIPMTILYWAFSSVIVGFLWVGAAQIIIWRQGDVDILRIPTWCLLGLAGLASVGLALWQGHGGRMFLSGRGVELHYRRTSVWCPWALFAADGEPSLTAEGDGVWLPVAAAAVPLIEVRKSGRNVPHADNLGTPLIHVAGQVALLYDHYAIEPQELARLLQKLGRAIASSRR